jgi:hypothetical protein
MNNGGPFADAISRLTAQAEAAGQLAQDGGAFAAVVAAFESRDPNAFRWVLGNLELLPRCELICEWVRTKVCVLRCWEVCGQPAGKVATPSLQEFANAVARLASNDKQLSRAVDAVACGNADEYRAVINELELRPYCYLLCHWICSIIYRRVCEVVCLAEPVRFPDALNEIRADAKVIAQVAANEKLLSVIQGAVVNLDCEILQSTLATAGLMPVCEIICFFVCVWRCVWVCRELCTIPPILTSTAEEVEEARSFALAAQQFAAQPRALGDLVMAVQNRDAQAYAAIISRYGLGPYCHQVCAWICSVVCYEFCICICPPPALQPWFTTVGNFDIYTQIDPTSGLTNTSLTPTVEMPWGGGPNYAFNGQLQLGGFCPATSPTHPGVQMQFRFLYASATTTLATAINATQTTITVSSGAITPATPFDASVCICSPSGETGEIMTVTGVSGTTWTVVRGAAGSAAAAAVAGTTLFINPQPITGPLVTSPLLVGQDTFPWPGQSGGLATATTVSTFRQVYVGYKSDPPPPAVGSAWYAPVHYVAPDPSTGWVLMDTGLIAGSVTAFLNFDTTKAPATAGGAPFGSDSLAVGEPGGAPAGSAVNAANQKAGSDLAIIFQATRATALPTVDYSNSLCKIHINNWTEVNNLWFQEFTTGGASCCTPIDNTLSVQFTVDHEELGAGDWGLSISSCPPAAGSTCSAAPGGITPNDQTPGVTFVVGDNVTTLAAPITPAQTSITVTSSGTGLSTPFNVSVSGTGETMTVTGIVGTTWTVSRGQAGTTAAAAPAGATLVTYRGASGTIVENTSTWCSCSYIAFLSTRPGLTTGLFDYRGREIYLTFCICGHGAS